VTNSRVPEVFRVAHARVVSVGLSIPFIHKISTAEYYGHSRLVPLVLSVPVFCARADSEVPAERQPGLKALGDFQPGRRRIQRTHRIPAPNENNDEKFVSLLREQRDSFSPLPAPAPPVCPGPALPGR